MPRVPNKPNTDYVLTQTTQTTYASDDIKLKIIERDLHNKLTKEIAGIKEVKFVKSHGLVDEYEVIYTIEKPSDSFFVTKGMFLDIKSSAEECTEIGDAYIDQELDSETSGHLFVLKNIDDKTGIKTFDDVANIFAVIGTITDEDIDNLFSKE